MYVYAKWIGMSMFMNTQKLGAQIIRKHYLEIDQKIMNPLTLSKFLMSLSAPSGSTRALTTGLSARATAFLALS